MEEMEKERRGRGAEEEKEERRKRRKERRMVGHVMCNIYSNVVTLIQELLN